MPYRRRHRRHNPARRGLREGYSVARQLAKGDKSKELHYRKHVRRGAHGRYSLKAYRAKYPYRLNPHRRRHHNPLGVPGGEIINFAVGGLGLAMAQPIVNKFLGGFLPLGTFQGPVITAVTGWGLGKVFGMFNATRRFAQPTMIIGLSTAVIQIVQPYVSNLLAPAAPAPATPATGMSGWPGGYAGWNRLGAMRRRPGFPMRGIGVVTGIPPTITAPLMPPTPQATQR
jgi:hypothetical protein